MTMFDREGAIEKLHAGTADGADVYKALGWEIVPHSRWGGRVAKKNRDGRLSAVGRVTRDAGAALHLIRDDRQEEAVRAAMALNGEFAVKTWEGGCPIARRICVIAISRPDLQSRYADPSH